MSLLSVLAIAACGEATLPSEDTHLDSQKAPVGSCAGNICSWFTRNPAGTDTSITDAAVSLIRGTPAGDTIRIASFRLDDSSGHAIADALVAAANGGAVVKFLMGGGFSCPGLAGSPLAKVCANSNIQKKFCNLNGNNSCIGTNIMHSKFLTTSRSNGSSFITFVTSHNWNTGSGEGTYNHATAVFNDLNLWNAMKGYFESMWTETAPATKTLVGSYANVYMSPQQNDFVYDLLFNHTVDPNKPGCQIFVMPGNNWEDSRGSLASGLALWKYVGCDVRVVASEQAALGPQVYSELSRYGVPIYWRWEVHDKAFVVSGRDTNNNPKNVVMLGSHNLEGNALTRNDEALMRVVNSQGTYDAYVSHFLRIVQPFRPSFAKTEVVIFRPKEGNWYFKDAPRDHGWYGLNGDIPLLADFQADGRYDIAVWRPSNGSWYWINPDNTTSGVQWGLPGDVPVTADFNGDGATDFTVWRPSTGVWYVRNILEQQYGQAGDIPVAANFAGDGRAELAVWRPSNGVWYILGVGEFLWGLPGDIPVPADYDGNGVVDLAVWRPSDGKWYLRNLDGSNERVFQYGLNGDIPVPRDYNGDGIADLAVFRPSSGTWYINGVGQYAWGANGDLPPRLTYIP